MRIQSQWKLVDLYLITVINYWMEEFDEMKEDEPGIKLTIKRNYYQIKLFVNTNYTLFININLYPILHIL